MAKRRVPAGLRGTVRVARGGSTSKPPCGARPRWIRGVGTPAPRLMCVLHAGHRAKKHQDSRGHRWDAVGGAPVPARPAAVSS